MSVFVLDTNKRPLAPCHEAKARKLLDAGKAAIFRRYPFTIILKRPVEAPTVPELRIKLDPGSKTTGIAIVNDATGEVSFAAELTHRGHQIRAIWTAAGQAAGGDDFVTPDTERLAFRIGEDQRAGCHHRCKAGSATSPLG